MVEIEIPGFDTYLSPFISMYPAPEITYSKT